MSSRVDRAILTSRMITHLRADNFIVGDAIAPRGSGWQQHPGGDASQFKPYVVITPMTASAPAGSIGDPASEWRLPYTLTTYGVDRAQVEDHADDVGRSLDRLRRVKLTMHDETTTWTIQQVAWSSIGGVGVATAVDPTAYSQSDSALVWISKNL